MKPLLTVVIPVYNVEKYLKRCIESILIQEWKNYDILLVDDGSTDNSPQICDDYAKAYEFISVIHKKNGGLSAARNTGISHAEGEYVYFPDSDDWIEPDTFMALAEVVESQKFDIISFNREFVKGEEDAICFGFISDFKFLRVKLLLCKCLSIVILLVLLMIKSIESLYLLIMTFSFLLVNTMRILALITNSFYQLKRSMQPIKSIITI